MKLLLLATAILFLSGCVSRPNPTQTPERELPCWMTEESPESNYWISSK